MLNLHMWLNLKKHMIWRDKPRTALGESVPEARRPRSSADTGGGGGRPLPGSIRQGRTGAAEPIVDPTRHARGPLAAHFWVPGPQRGPTPPRPAPRTPGGSAAPGADGGAFPPGGEQGENSFLVWGQGGGRGERGPGDPQRQRGGAGAPGSSINPTTTGGGPAHPPHGDGFWGRRPGRATTLEGVGTHPFSGARASNPVKGPRVGTARPRGQGRGGGKGISGANPASGGSAVPVVFLCTGPPLRSPPACLKGARFSPFPSRRSGLVLRRPVRPSPTEGARGGSPSPPPRPKQGPQGRGPTFRFRAGAPPNRGVVEPATPSTCISGAKPAQPRPSP